MYLLRKALAFSPREALQDKFGGGVPSASQNRYPTYEQNLGFLIPYLWPDHKSIPRFRPDLQIIPS